MKLEWYKHSNTILFTGLMMLAAGLPVSLFLTSLSQFFIAGSFFLEGRLKEKINRIKNNRLALLISGIWLLHLVGILWTSDMQEGMKDLRIKLPLLIIPLVLAGSSPLSPKQFHWIMWTFTASVFTGSMVSLAVYAGIIPGEIENIRDIFILGISHIRFALFVCLSIFFLLYTVQMKFRKESNASLIPALILVTCFIAFLIFIESITGIIILSITLVIQILILAYSRSGRLSRSILILIAILIPSFLLIKTIRIINEYHVRHEYPVSPADTSSLGNYYTPFSEERMYENGYPVWEHVCEIELRPAWNNLSSIPYDSLDGRGQELRFTLIRFLTSKGERKDADGLKSLSSAEINSIERGIANVRYQDMSDLNMRLTQIAWEIDHYRKGSNPGGHSVTQRLEFWKAALRIIAAHPLIGVGTGDLRVAYRNEYIQMKSVLDEKYRLRAHNQYLSFAVGLGIPFLLYFMFTMIYSLRYKKLSRNYLFRSFWIISVLSMISEDTLETQAGVTFFAFFLALIAFSVSLEESSDKKDVSVI